MYTPQTSPPHTSCSEVMNFHEFAKKDLHIYIIMTCENVPCSVSDSHKYIETQTNMCILNTQTHTHIHIYIYIYTYVCVCNCNYVFIHLHSHMHTSRVCSMDFHIHIIHIGLGVAGMLFHVREHLSEDIETN